MSESNDPFEERLKRLTQKAEVTQTPLSELRFKSTSAPATTSDTQGGASVVAIAAVVMFLIGAGAFGVMLLAPELVFSGPVGPAELFANN